MSLMDKLKDKKGGKPLDPMYKDAKMSMLHELRNAMSGSMKSDLENAKGMKKVTVAGSDPEAVAAGLDKAKEMVAGEGASDEAKAPEGAQEIASDLSEAKLSTDDIDMLMQMLEKKKQEMSGSADQSDEMGSSNKFGL